MKKTTIFFISLIVLVILSTEIYAVGLVLPPGSGDEIYFEPNKVIKINYGVRNSNDFGMYTKPYVECALSEYITIEPETIYVEPNEIKGFTVTIEFPENIDTPGFYDMTVNVIEDRPGGEIGARAAIKSRRGIRVEHPGKYMNAMLLDKSTNEGEPLELEVAAQNFGKENISRISGTVDIINPDGSKKETVALPIMSDVLIPRKEKRIKTNISTKSYSPGTYSAIANIDYDGINTDTNKAKIKIGTLNVDLINHTVEAYADTINNFEIEVESTWNAKTDIYGIVQIAGGRSFRTFPETLERWEKKKLSGYLDSNGLKPGIYPIDITLHYGEEKKEISSEIEILKKPIVEEPVDDNIHTIVLLGIILAVILSVNLLLLFLLTKKKGKKK